MTRHRIRASAAPWNAAIYFYITSRDGKARVREVVMERTEEMASGDEPSFRLDTDEAQILIDDLWNAGLRPTEGSGSAGALKAVENHLQDMRTLVFQAYSQKQP